MSESSGSRKKNEGRVFLIDLVNRAGKIFLRDNPTLDALESGEADRDTWRRFAVQRYLAALPFERLLKACMRRAQEVNDAGLVKVLASNLADENGIDASGHVHPDLSHATWRKDFYTALGIGEEELLSAIPSEGTRVYEAMLDGLTATSGPLVMAGALLVLEGTIPHEFARMRRGRDITFHDVFVQNDSDTEEMSQTKARARVYLDDHITHDAKSHYPDLLRSLEPYTSTSKGREEIQEGASIVAEAKSRFYKNWDN